MGGLVEQNTPFFTVKTLIARLLELDSCKNIHEREQLILQHITDEEMRKFLPLLNDILVLKVTRQYAVYHAIIARSRIVNLHVKIRLQLNFIVYIALFAHTTYSGLETGFVNVV